MSSSNQTKARIADCEQNSSVALRIKNLERFMFEKQIQKGAEKCHPGSKRIPKEQNALPVRKPVQEGVLGRKDRRTGGLSNANKEACLSGSRSTYDVSKPKTAEQVISGQANRCRDDKNLGPLKNANRREASQPVDGTQAKTNRESIDGATVAKVSKTPPPPPLKVNRPKIGQASTEARTTKPTPPSLPSKLNRPRLREEDQVENSEQLPSVQTDPRALVPEENSRLQLLPPVGETAVHPTIVINDGTTEYQNVDVITPWSVHQGQRTADQRDTENVPRAKDVMAVAGVSSRTAEGTVTSTWQPGQVNGTGSGREGIDGIKHPNAPPLPSVPRQTGSKPAASDQNQSGQRSTGQRSTTGLDAVHTFNDSPFTSFDEYVVRDENRDDDEDDDEDDDDIDWDDDEFDEYDDTLERTVGRKSDNLKYETLCKKRKRVVQELFTTEVNYVNKLLLLNKTALQIEGANMCLEMFDWRRVKVMFPCVENLYRLHSEHILPALRTVMDEWSTNSSIFQMWEKYLPFLTMYTTYTRLHHGAMDTMRKLKESCPTFDTMMHKIEEQPGFGNLTLSDHMLEPIQRLSRYKLLLQNYTKHLRDGEEEKAKMTAIIQTVSQLLDDCENQLRND